MKWLLLRLEDRLGFGEGVEVRYGVRPVWLSGQRGRWRLILVLRALAGYELGGWNRDV